MPFINVKLIEDVFTPDQKRRIVEELTDAMVAIEGREHAPGHLGRGRGSPQR
jgi:4-oxalocrotonate tautomerase